VLLSDDATSSIFQPRTSFLPVTAFFATSSTLTRQIPGTTVSGDRHSDCRFCPLDHRRRPGIDRCHRREPRSSPRSPRSPATTQHRPLPSPPAPVVTTVTTVTGDDPASTAAIAASPGRHHTVTVTGDDPASTAAIAASPGRHHTVTVTGDDSASTAAIAASPGLHHSEFRDQHELYSISPPTHFSLAYKSPR